MNPPDRITLALDLSAEVAGRLQAFAAHHDVDIVSMARLLLIQQLDAVSPQRMATAVAPINTDNSHCGAQIFLGNTAGRDLGGTQAVA